MVPEVGYPGLLRLLRPRLAITNEGHGHVLGQAKHIIMWGLPKSPNRGKMKLVGIRPPPRFDKFFFVGTINATL